MIKILALINVADQFLKARNWWQFHNPKNDSTNIVVEVGELAELFIDSAQIEKHKAEIANEMADVLFSLINFISITNVDLVKDIRVYIYGPDLNFDLNNLASNTSYDDLAKLVLENLDQFGLARLEDPQAIMLSLVRQATLLADLFIWSSGDEALVRAQIKQDFIVKRVLAIFAHLVYLASLLEIDLPAKYLHKMTLNAKKYPIDIASGSDYVKIKDQTRN